MLSAFIRLLDAPRPAEIYDRSRLSELKENNQLTIEMKSLSMSRVSILVAIFLNNS